MTAAPAVARPCAVPSGAPVSKAEYESRFVSALLPTHRTEELASQLTNRTSRVRAAYVFRRIQKIFRRACRAAGRIAPPLEIASLHRQVVTALGGLAWDAREARIGLHEGNRRRYRRALGGFRHYGRQLTRLGRLLRAKGY